MRTTRHAIAGRAADLSRRLNHDVFRSGRPKNMSVIDSKKLRRGMRAENRTHFSSSRSDQGMIFSRRVTTSTITRTPNMAKSRQRMGP
ncbi:hypothetical protein GHJ84_19815 [Sinorhizobium meliloti]|nr:hypothetical protein [Sinorhizobium meliloti]